MLLLVITIIVAVCFIFSLFVFVQVTDSNSHHDFVTSGVLDSQKRMVMYYAGRFSDVSHQYHALAKCQFINETDGDIAAEGAAERGGPLVLRGVEPNRVHDMLLYDFDEGDSGRHEPEIEVGLTLCPKRIGFEVESMESLFFYRFHRLTASLVFPMQKTNLS